MPIELGFLLDRFAEMAEDDEAPRARRPWKAAHERDFAWLGAAMTKHSNRDHTDGRILIDAILEAFAGHTVEHDVDSAERFLRDGAHTPRSPAGWLAGWAAPRPRRR